MSLFRLLLSVSLLANLVFAVHAWRGISPAAAFAGGGAEMRKAGPADVFQPSRAIRPSESEPRQNFGSNLGWSALAGAAIRDFATRLRDAGWPESLVRRLTREEIDRRNPPFPNPAQAELAAFEFWHCGQQADPWEGEWSAADAEKSRQRFDENEEQFRELFGADAWSEEDPRLAAWQEQRRWGNLPPEKRGVIEEILADGEALRNGVLEAVKGPLLPGDRAALALVETEIEHDIAATLSEAEYQDYRLRNSDTANRMRWELERFKPSEEEFLAIFNIREGFDREYEARWQTEPANDTERMAAEAGARESINQALGEKRFADYRRATDPRFAELEALARRTNTPAQMVEQLYDLARSAAGDAARLAAVKHVFAKELGAEATLAYFGHRG